MYEARGGWLKIWDKSLGISPIGGKDHVWQNGFTFWISSIRELSITFTSTASICINPSNLSNSFFKYKVYAVLLHVSIEGDNLPPLLRSFSKWNSRFSHECGFYGLTNKFPSLRDETSNKSFATLNQDNPFHCGKFND